MATRSETVDYIMEQLASAGPIRSRKMFGEYAVYCDDKVVAFVCDDQLFIKPTPVVQEYLDAGHQAPPYPGAKDYFVVPPERWEDHEWLSGIVRATANVLPQPKPKKR